jgi:MoaA/NifB/PqqE/SkfB family radical SAM enzyme
VEPTYRPAEEIIEHGRRIIAEWDHGPGPNIGLHGPEPFGHPDLVECVGAIVQSGVQRLCIATDGVALRSEQNALGIMAAGIRHVRVSMLGSSALHDDLQGAKGSHEAAIAGMKLVRDAAARAQTPFLLCGYIPVCQHNLHDIPAAVVELAHAGASAVQLDVDDAALPNSAGQWLQAAVETGIVNGTWVSVVGGEFPELQDRSIHYRWPVTLLEMA